MASKAIRLSADELDALDTLRGNTAPAAASAIATDCGWTHSKAASILANLREKKLARHRGYKRGWEIVTLGLIVYDIATRNGREPGVPVFDETIAVHCTVRDAVRDRMRGGGPWTAGELARAMGVPRTSVYVALRHLEGREHVSRVRNARPARWAITTAGIAALENE